MFRNEVPSKYIYIFLLLLKDIPWNRGGRVPMRHNHEAGFHTFANLPDTLSVRNIYSKTHQKPLQQEIYLVKPFRNPFCKKYCKVKSARNPFQ